MPHDSDSAAVALSPVPPPVGDRRTLFAQNLSARLRKHGIALASANLGSQGGHSVWVLAVQLRSRRVVTLSASLDESVPDAYSDEACQVLCERILRWVTDNSG